MNSDPTIEGLKALGHLSRFRIVQALQAGERNVSEIEEVTGIGQPALSQQLAVLRGAGLVETRKEAKLVFYRIDGGTMAALAAAIRPFLPQAAAIAPAHPSLPPPSAGVANFARLTRK